MTQIAELPGRAVLEIAGDDRVAFLQGLVSNDVTVAAPGRATDGIAAPGRATDGITAPGRAVWAALLTPQGKYVADFFILADAGRLLLDTDADRRDHLAKLLSRYRLRAAVTVTALDLPVAAAWDGPAPNGPIAAPDPRIPDAGWRLLGSPVQPNATADDYDRHRLRLGLPDGVRDLEPDKSTLVESGFDELGGIDWEKGCYMGQELTARTKYRGLVKRRLTRIRVDGKLPPPGTPVMHGDAEVGTMRSGNAGQALASLRLEAIDAPALTCGQATIYPDPAPWMRWKPVKLATA